MVNKLMKKILLVSLILIQSSMMYAQKCCVNESTCIKQFPIIEGKIMQLYENVVFETAKDPNFKISEICTADFLQRLENANDYDTKGYATWLLRSGMQDGDNSPSKVISIVPGNDNTIITTVH